MAEKLIRVFDVFWNTTMIDRHSPHYRRTEEQQQWVYEHNAEGDVFRRLAWCLHAAPDSMVVVMSRRTSEALYHALPPDDEDTRTPRQIKKAAARAKRKAARRAKE